MPTPAHSKPKGEPPHTAAVPKNGRQRRRSKKVSRRARSVSRHVPPTRDVSPPHFVGDRDPRKRTKIYRDTTTHAAKRCAPPVRSALQACEASSSSAKTPFPWYTPYDKPARPSAPVKRGQDTRARPCCLFLFALISVVTENALVACSRWREVLPRPTSSVTTLCRSFSHYSSSTPKRATVGI